MAVVVYKPNKEGVITKIVNEFSYTDYLEKGWFLSPEDFPKKKVEKNDSDKK